MTQFDWAALPIVEIPVRLLTWPCHDIDPAHVHSVLATSEQGPIWAEELVDGSWFIHNGRHRALRAKAAGYASISAHALRSHTIRTT